MVKSGWGATDSTSLQSADVDVIVVGGGGVAGLYLLYRLKGLGLSATAFEAGTGIAIRVVAATWTVLSILILLPAISNRNGIGRNGTGRSRKF
jgi:flavin-dependent dehydrogenase